MNRAERLANNGELIARVASQGYIRGRVLDATFGNGIFWRRYMPKRLVTLDARDLAAIQGSFTRSPFRPKSFATVVFDPPYKLNGRPDSAKDGSDYRYGVDSYARWQDRMQLISDGVDELEGLLADGGHLLVKCMDQVVSGAMRWQTDLVTERAQRAGLVKVERHDMLTRPRPQPEGRASKHCQANYSTLLIFKRPGRRAKKGFEATAWQEAAA